MAPVIDFNLFGGPVYAGRSQGEQARVAAKLDELDGSSSPVQVVIPDNAYTLSSGFFLGLFGPSIQAAGTPKAFFEHYCFQAPDFMAPLLEDYVRRALAARNLLPVQLPEG